MEGDKDQRGTAAPLQGREAGKLHEGGLRFCGLLVMVRQSEQWIKCSCCRYRAVISGWFDEGAGAGRWTKMSCAERLQKYV